MIQTTRRGALAVAALALSSLPVLCAAQGAAAIGPLPEKKPPAPGLVEMGRRLFFDPRISGDGAISCASCHDPKQGFARQVDAKGKPMLLSDAYPGTNHFRNAPTLLNTTHKSAFANVGWGWAGHMGADLNDVVRDMLTETAVMNMDMRLMHERMKQDPVYVKMCADNFKGGECSSPRARVALVAFMDTLVSRDAPFDTGKMSDAAKRGQQLFTGKAGCASCHSGPYFSDGKPHNTGVPENMEVFNDPVRHLTYRAAMYTHGVPKADHWRRDVGYFLVSKNYGDVGKFVTPTLRELKYTAPYMHNGVIGTLAEVVEFYDRGGGKDDPLATELKPLGLAADEKKDLVAFLEALSSVTPVTAAAVEFPKDYAPLKSFLSEKN